MLLNANLAILINLSIPEIKIRLESHNTNKKTGVKILKIKVYLN